MLVGQTGVSGRGANPPFRFHRLICEWIQKEHSYSIYVLTTPIGTPVSILVRVGQSGGVSGGPNPPFRFHTLICQGLKEHSFSVNVFTLPIGAPVSILARVGQRGVGSLGESRPHLSVPHANMRRVWERTIILTLLSIRIHYSNRNTCIDFGARRSKGGTLGDPTPLFGFAL